MLADDHASEPPPGARPSAAILDKVCGTISNQDPVKCAVSLLRHACPAFCVQHTRRWRGPHVQKVVLKAPLRLILRTCSMESIVSLGVFAPQPEALSKPVSARLDSTVRTAFPNLVTTGSE
jgi:hypothetical protein